MSARPFYPRPLFPVVVRCQVIVDGIHLFRCNRHPLPGLVVCEKHFDQHERLVTKVALKLIDGKVAHRWVFG